MPLGKAHLKKHPYLPFRATKEGGSAKIPTKVGADLFNFGLTVDSTNT